jgi:hypothetical protein
MFAYIGHGKIVSNGQLAFASSAGKTVTWPTIQTALLGEDEALKDVDVFCFLDCCYSGTARSKNGSDRSSDSRRRRTTIPSVILLIALH